MCIELACSPQNRADCKFAMPRSLLTLWDFVRHFVRLCGKKSFGRKQGFLPLSMMFSPQRMFRPFRAQ